MDIYKLINEYKEKGHDLVLVTVTNKEGMAPSDIGKKILYVDNGEFFGTVGGGLIEFTALETCKEVLRKRQSRTVNYVLDNNGQKSETAVVLPMACGGGATLYYEFIGPKQYVYLFGGGHCNKALAPILLDLGFEVIVIDKRKEVLDSVDSRATLVNDEFISFINKKVIKDNAFIVVATPSHHSDFDVLDNIFINKFNYKYLGMVCSKKKIKEYVLRLKEKGVVADLSRLYAPVGLLMGGDSPLEVALSIAAEIISVYYHNDDRVTHLRDLLVEEDRYFL